MIVKPCSKCGHEQPFSITTARGGKIVKLIRCAGCGQEGEPCKSIVTARILWNRIPRKETPNV